jgi:cysteine-rich repeat protein
MRMRTLGLAAALSAGLFQSSDAVVHQKAADAPVVSANRAPRTHRTVGWVKGGARLQAAGLTSWTAIWDRDTEVPLRLWGRGILAQGAVTNPAIAEAAARQFLTSHIATLAPGASASDFVLVSNQLGGAGNTRSVGFEQRANGVRVVGGTIGFTFKHDRLVMVGSTALPNVAVALPAKRLASTTIAAKATSWLASDGYVAAAQVAHGALASERVIIPIVRPRRGTAIDVTYQVAEHVSLTASDGTPGAWDVWVDATDGAPIMRRNRLHFASGKVLFNVPDRHPGGTRSAKPASFATHTINGAAVTSTLDGSVTWASGSGSVALKARGPLVAVTGGLTETMTLADGGSITWNKSTVETSDAQLSGFVHAAIVKQFAKTRLDPGMAWLDGTLSVSVNESSSCNAYSTGDDIHFYRKSSQCENTARLADVVYHEFGHSLHAHAIIEGVGQFDGALSEGMSDALAALITHDSGMGRGFFLSNAPMRELNPPSDKRWPEDTTGEVHDDGEIIGGTMWDLLVALEGKLGATAGYDKTLEIFYGMLQRSADIPSSYAEALVADDDDGDLANGTPNQCEINTIFKNHGLADGVVTAGISAPVRDHFNITLDTTPTSSECPGPAVQSATVEWRPRGGSGGEVTLVQSGTTYEGAIPTQPDGTVVQYKVTVTLENGSTVSYPNNPADPFYEFYVGYVETLWCSDFETGAADWTHGATPTASDEWEAGEPLGLGGDPKTAFGGANVFGTDLSNDGAYTKQSSSFAESSEIDLQGHADARLQYRRWLGVEDGFYDSAKILINGQEVWTNFASASEPQQSGVNHLDKEWRFQDIELAQFAQDGKVKLRFEIATDEGLQFGGWTMDDVCIVIPAAGPPPGCGNGVTEAAEVCDDGNITDGDGCSSTCEDESDGGGEGGTDPGGCCSTGSRPEGAIALGLIVLGLVFRRRRTNS